MNSKEKKNIKNSYSFASTAAYFFIAPALLAILIFFFIPVIAAFVISFTDFDIYALGNFNTVRFVGRNNYIRLFEDPLFWLS